MEIIHEIEVDNDYFDGKRKKRRNKWDYEVIIETIGEPDIHDLKDPVLQEDKRAIIVDELMKQDQSFDEYHSNTVDTATYREKNFYNDLETELDISFNAYKEKQRRKPSKPKLVQILTTTDGERSNYLLIGEWFQSKLPAPSLPCRSSMQFILIAVVIVAFSLLIRFFYKLPKSLFEDSGTKDIGNYGERAKESLLTRLKRIISHIYDHKKGGIEEEDDVQDHENYRTPYKRPGFIRSYTQRESQSHRFERIALEEDFINQFTEILKEFLNENPMKDLSDPNILFQTVANPSKLTQDENASVKSRKKKQWKEDYQEIERIYQSISIIEKCFRDMMNNQKQKSFSSQHHRGIMLFPFSVSSAPSLTTKTKELIRLKEVTLLYYRYLVVVLNQLSYYLSHHHSSEIYQCIRILDAHIQSYDNQNKLFEQHVLQDLLYRQGILKAFQTHHNSPYSSDQDFLLPDIIMRIDAIVDDFYLARRNEIEQHHQLLLSSSIAAPSGCTPSLIRSNVTSPDSGNETANNELFMITEDESYIESRLIVSQQASNSITPIKEKYVNKMTTATHQQTFQLIQFFHQQDYSKRIQESKSEKEKLIRESYTRSHTKFQDMLKEERARENDLERQMVQNDAKYQDEIKQLDARVDQIGNELISLQHGRNDVIFNLYLIILLLLIVVASADCAKCENGDVWLCAERTITMVFGNNEIKTSFSRCIFQAFEKICLKINRDHFSTFFSASYAPSILSSHYHIFDSMLSTISYVVTFLNPDRWLSFQYYLLPFSRTLSPYFQILYTFLMLLIRYAPILICSKILPFFGISWQPASTIHHHFHHPLANRSSVVDVVHSFFSSLTIIGIIKAALYLFCFGDIFLVMFTSFFKLLFIPCFVHFVAYQVFQSYALRLICQEGRRGYVMIYVVYFVALMSLTTVASIQWVM